MLHAWKVSVRYDLPNEATCRQTRSWSCTRSAPKGEVLGLYIASRSAGRPVDVSR